MSMQMIDTRRWHEIYETLDKDDKEAIDTAFDKVQSVLEDALPVGVNLGKMDDAEMLVASITKYFIEGRIIKG